MLDATVPNTTVPNTTVLDTMVAGTMDVGTRRGARRRSGAREDGEGHQEELAQMAHPSAIGRWARLSEAARAVCTQMTGFPERAFGFILSGMGGDRV